MKTPLKYIAGLLAVILVGAMVINSPEIRAQMADPQREPVSVVVNPAPRQYRVIDINLISRSISQSQAGAIESGLNGMGGQGWQLVAVSGSYLIMMR